MDFETCNQRLTDSIIYSIIEKQALTKAFTNRKQAHEYYRKKTYYNTNILHLVPIRMVNEKGFYPDDKDEIPIYIVIGGGKLIRAYSSKVMSEEAESRLNELFEDVKFTVVEIPLYVDYSIYTSASSPITFDRIA